MASVWRNEVSYMHWFKTTPIGGVGAHDSNSRAKSIRAERVGVSVTSTKQVQQEGPAAATTKGRRTEAAFMDAAREVFREKGYFNAKIADIAKAAGRSPGSFYNYYESKEQLLDALLDQFADEVRTESVRTRHRGDPYENVLDAVRAYWSAYQKYLPEMIGVFQMSMTDKAYAKRWRDNRTAGILSVIDGITRAQRDNYANDVDAEAMASALVSMLESYCWVWMATEGDAVVQRPDDETSIRTLATICHRALFYKEPAS